jgi:hypothetical protein
MSAASEFRQPNIVDALIRSLKSLLEARTTADMHSVLSRDQALLLTDAAVKKLEALHRDEMLESPNDNVYGPGYIGIHKSLLLACKALGLAEGWKDWSAKFVGPMSREYVREHYRTGFGSSIMWKRGNW